MFCRNHLLYYIVAVLSTNVYAVEITESKTALVKSHGLSQNKTNLDALQINSFFQNPLLNVLIPWVSSRNKSSSLV